MHAGMYFDHHATTPLDPAALEAMLPWLTPRFGNAASLSHAWGDAARAAVAQAQDEVAALLGCEPQEIVWTSGATEANNLAIKGVMLAAGPGSHLIVNAAEHRAVLDPARRLLRARFATTILPVPSTGAVDPDAVADALRPETRLVSAMWANNEVGTLNDLTSIGAHCRARGVRLHADAVPAVGRVPIDLRTAPVDLLSLSAHKFGGPQGIGALIVRRREDRLPIEPLLDGGGHQQGLRSGTLPVGLIVGLTAALRRAVADREAESLRLATLRDRLWSTLRAALPDILRNGNPARCLPHNLNVTIPGIDGDALLAKLRETELGVSSGAACSSANPEPSHVLRAIGRTDAEARASLRFGLGRANSAADVDRAVAIVVTAVQSLHAARST